MKLLLVRRPSGEHATLGDLSLDGMPYCVTLEDVVRDLGPDGKGKIFGATAIPVGIYQVIIDFSQRFQKNMLHVMNVPFFTGIRIHSGNTDANTEGCILVGQVVVGNDYIHGGSVVLPDLLAKVQTAINNGDTVTLEIQ